MDGTRRPRSPGSTLKPFVYALALDQGRIHPLTLLKDAPRSFGDYNPENFDRDFLGPIRASDALARSRNVPAVTLASELSHPTLYEFLRDADVSLPQPASHYGLSLPLGGAEVTMEDLVRLYATLANGGRLQPLRRLLNEPPGRQPAGCSRPEAAFLTLEMLGQIPQARNDVRRRRPAGAGLLENRHVARISRRVVGRGLRSLCAGGLGRQLRWTQKSRVYRPHGRGAAPVSNDRRLARGASPRVPNRICLRPDRI